jgi:hypothetical protein
MKRSTNPKQCPRCRKVKPWSEFYILKSGQPSSWCKVCESQYKRECCKPNHEKHVADCRKYKKNHPEQVRAWGFVYRHVKAGRLAKPDKCQICGKSPAQAHHPDYSRPLDVLWLCLACHRNQHGIVLHPK